MDENPRSLWFSIKDLDVGIFFDCVQVRVAISNTLHTVNDSWSVPVLCTVIVMARQQLIWRGTRL